MDDKTELLRSSIDEGYSWTFEGMTPVSGELNSEMVEVPYDPANADPALAQFHDLPDQGDG